METWASRISFATC